MTSIIVNEHGGPEKYVVTDDADSAAAPNEGQLQVRLSLAGVNFLDVVQRRGGTPVTAPFAPGVEGVGTVTAVGAGVDGFTVGDRVGWMTGGQGSFSSTALVRADKAVPLPDDIDDETAVAALIQGITAHYLTTSTFPISAGDVVVIHAAAGGLGQILTQIAAAKGATVIGTTSTEEKAEIARANGAAHVFGYDDFAEKVREVSGGEGASVIFDGVGATTFTGDLKALRTRGTLVVVGNASGPVPAVDVNTLSASGSLFLTRPTVVDHVRTPEELRSRTDEVFGWIRSGDLTVHIGNRFPLTEVAAAFTALESRATTGKIILQH